MTRDLYDNRWFQTIKGNTFFLFDPIPEDFDIEEIAHGLSMQCRFNGHVKQFYSVAQHSVLVSHLLEQWGESRDIVFCGLMHDAAESYIGDLIRPVKRVVPAYGEIEVRIEKVIAQRFGLPYPFPDVIKKADTTMLLVEKRDLLAPPPRPWFEVDLPLPEWGVGPELNWRGAKGQFLGRFSELTQGIEENR